MCGILGFSDRPKKQQTQALLKLIHHRGYDESVVGFAAGCNFGMNRLAIQDLTQGYYPFKYKRWQMVYNGEIYNYPQLKKLLARQGYLCTTNCDAEIILPLFEKYGPRAFSKLEGMFAIAIFDTQHQTITLARDKSGEKPLYYSLTPKLAFASEIKVLLKIIPEKRLNHQAVADYLHHGSIFSSQTLVHSIYKVPAGSYLTYYQSTQTFELKPYWQPNLELELETHDPVRTLDHLLTKAVHSRLLSDVPVGCFMSGGVDSSLVACLASQKISNLHTYSVGFPHAHNRAHYDESSYAEQVAGLIGSHHQTIVCTAESIREPLYKLSQLIDEPISDPAVLPTFLLTQTARQKIKVALTGEGSDELFGGYYRYYKQLLYHGAHLVTSRAPWLNQIRESLAPDRYQAAFLPLLQTYSPQKVWQVKELSHLMVSPVPVSPPSPELMQLSTTHPLLALQLTDYFGYLPEQLLMKVDKISMSNNLETRAPFLDSAVINFTFNLPFDQKFRFPHNKYLLRQVADLYLPAEIVWRPKHGFSVPLDEWFRNELADYVNESALLVANYPQLFHSRYYNQLVTRHLSGTHNFKDKIWSVSILVNWLHEYQIEV